MEPELAVALPAAGWACTAALRPRPRLALAAGAAFGLGGVAAIFLSAPGISSTDLGVSLTMSAAARALLVVSAAALAFIVILAPARAERSSMLRWGLAGLAGMTAIAVAPSLDVAVVILLAMVVLQASTLGRRPYLSRVRGPLLAIVLLGLGLVFARVTGPPSLQRIAAVGLITGLVAALGAVPFVQDFDAEEMTATSPMPWLAFVGPLLAIVVVARSRLLIPGQVDVLGALLIALGLLNVVFGSVAAWRVDGGAAAWRYLFMADWGLAMCGLGLGVSDGLRAALLILFALLLVRLPLYLWSRQALRANVQEDRPVNLLVAAALAGSAPFAGFPARVLLLKSATAMYWPLALVIAPLLLLWIPAGLRLGRTLGAPTGRQLLGVGLALAISVALGAYPQPLLALAGL
jgi:iron complex transport system permease protein